MRFGWLVVLAGCGSASGPSPSDAATEAAVDAAPEAGVCSYVRDDGTHVDCKSTDAWCPDPNPACGNDCTCEYAFDGFYLTCTPDQCGLDSGLD